MKFPKRLTELLNQKQEFIDSQRDRLSASMIKLQDKLFSDIISELIPELDIKDGIIQDTAKNYKLISTLDKTYRDFNAYYSDKVTGYIIAATKEITDLNEKYYSMMSEEIPKTFESVLAQSKKLIDLKIGLEGDKIFKGGWLDSYFNSSNIGTELKQITSQAVTSNMDKKDFIKLLKQKITGSEDYTGTLERQFNMYAYDLYQQYDSTYNLSVAKELELTYFLYQGTLIGDSRDFCAAHVHKVWSRDEAETWKDWTPSDGEYPAGWEVKAKDLYSHPGYMEVPGYDPFINRGGYHCRHALGWISDALAKRLRPNIKI